MDGLRRPPKPRVGGESVVRSDAKRAAKSNPKRNKKKEGYLPDLQRALLYEVARIRNEAPTAVNLLWALESNSHEQLTEEDILLGDPDAKNRIPSFNRCSTYLRAIHLMWPDELDLLVKIGGPRLQALRSNLFWRVYAQLPGFPDSFDVLTWPLRTRRTSKYVLIRPVDVTSILRLADRFDTLKGLGIRILFFGAIANNIGDEPLAAFDKVLTLISRISCVQPFAEFGDDFCSNVIRAMLSDPGMDAPRSDWRQVVKVRRNLYREIISFGRDLGLLRVPDGDPQGPAALELAALHLADEHGWNPSVRDAFYNFAKKGKRSLIVSTLHKRASHPAADLFA